MKSRLKPGGQVVMIDFQKRDLPVGPPAAMKIAREDLVAQMQTHGFEHDHQSVDRSVRNARVLRCPRRAARRSAHTALPVAIVDSPH
jgi:hypothetical protein